MWLPLKAIISNKPRKDGTSLIYFQYCYSSTNRVLLGTELGVPATYWNKKRQHISKSLPSEFGEVDQLNDEITRMRKVVEAIIEHGTASNVPNIGAYVKETFSPNSKIETLKKQPEEVLVRKKEPDFFAQIDDYILSKEKRLCSVAVIRGMKERLLAYQGQSKKPITFSSLDYSFYLDFVDFLSYDFKLKRKLDAEYGLKVSTIGSTIKNLRVFIRDRARRKIIALINLDDFKIVDEEADAVYLSYEEIGKIYHADLSAFPHLLVARDLFVLGCLTGLRFSDYSTLEFTDMRKGMLYKKTNKMDSWVVIPLRAEAKDIFIRQFKDCKPVISNPVFNRLIKEIATLAEINESVTFSYKKGNKDLVVTKLKAQWVTSHTCRRSFCTNEYLSGTDINLIMKISGHKTHKDFFKYIRIGQEEAALRIQKIWLARDTLMQALPA